MTSRTFVYDWLEKCSHTLSSLFNVGCMFVYWLSIYMTLLQCFICDKYAHIITSIYIYTTMCLQLQIMNEWKKCRMCKERTQKNWNEWMVCLTWNTDILHDLYCVCLCGKWTGSQMDDHFCLVYEKYL